MPAPPNSTRVGPPNSTPLATGFGPGVQQFGLGVMTGLGETMDPSGMARAELPVRDDSSWLERFVMQQYPRGVSAMLRPSEETPPATGGQRIAHRVGEQFGLTALFVAAPAARGAYAAARYIPGAATALLGRLGLETAITGAAGAGAGIANEAAPGSMAADIAGQVVGGGYVGAQSALRGWIWRGGKSLWNKVNPTPEVKAARASAGVGGIVGDLPPASMARGAELEQTMPGLSLSLAERTGRPDLVAQQARIEGTMGGAEAAAQRARREGNTAAIGAFAGQAAPGVERSPDFVVDAATGTISDLRAGLAASRGAAEATGAQATAQAEAQGARAQGTLAGQQAAVAGQHAAQAAALPQPNLANLGADMRTAFNEAEDAARAGMTARLDELGLANVQMFAPFNAFRNAVRAAFTGGKLTDPKNVPDAVARILAVRGPVTFGDLMALRKALGNDIRLASAGANANPMKRGQTEYLLKLLDREVFESPNTGGALGGMSDAYRTFRSEYRQNVIEPFENNTVYKVTQSGGRGFYTTRDEQIASLFFTPGGITQARNFKVVAAGNPAMQDSLIQAALDSLRQYAVRDGVLNLGRLQTWVRTHSSVLAEFPGLRASLADTKAVSEALAARSEQLVGRERQIQDAVLERQLRVKAEQQAAMVGIVGEEKALAASPLVRELDSYARAGKTADGVIAAALADPRKMTALRTMVEGNPDALAALQRHVWGVVDGQNPAQVAEYIRANGPSLAQVLDFKHLSDLQLIAEARMAASAVPNNIGAVYAPAVSFAEKMRQATGQDPRAAISAWLSVTRGRSNQPGELAAAAGRFMTRRTGRNVDDLLKEVMYDPELASAVAAATRPGPLPPKARRVLGAWFGIGVSPLGEEQ